MVEWRVNNRLRKWVKVEENAGKGMMGGYLFLTQLILMGRMKRLPLIC
ncbi:hypothetical protein CsSME_00048485 [Camellia sinensis var. sinensis]